MRRTKTWLTRADSSTIHRSHLFFFPTPSTVDGGEKKTNKNYLPTTVDAIQASSATAIHRDVMAERLPVNFIVVPTDAAILPVSGAIGWPRQRRLVLAATATAVAAEATDNGKDCGGSASTVSSAVRMDATLVTAGGDMTIVGGPGRCYHNFKT